MKKSLLVICLSLALYATPHAQQVPEVQKTLVTKITATWCPNCGNWGWDFFEDLIAENEEKAVFVGAHHSGDLDSAPGSSFSTNFMAPYQPYFYAGNQDLGASAGNASAKLQEAMDLIDANYLSAPVANVGFIAELENGTLNVTAKTKFFQEATGDFYLGLYILENGVVNAQASNSTMAIHPYVMRASFTSNDFGDSLMDGTVASGTAFTDDYTFTISNSNWVMDSLIIAGIIWEKTGNTYQFVNVNTTRNFNGAPVSTQPIPSSALAINLYPTIAKETAYLNLDLKEHSLRVNIQLFNVKGQAIRQIFQGELANGATSLEVPVSSLDAGVYFVNILSEDGALITKKLIVQ